MNQLDALLLLLLTPFALRGYWRGFCREIFGLGGIACHPETKGIHTPFVKPIKRFKCNSIATLGPLDRLGFIKARSGRPLARWLLFGRRCGRCCNGLILANYDASELLSVVSDCIH